MKFILLTLLLLAPLFIFAQGDFPVPTIAISPDTYYPLDEILYLEGRAETDSTVNVVFHKQGERPVKFNIKADMLGEWVLAEKVHLSSGHWEVRARTISSDGIASDWSNPRVLRSVITGFTILGINIRYITIVLPIVFIFLLGLGILVYSVLWVQKIRRREHEKHHEEEIEALEEKLLKKEVSDAKDVTARTFAGVRDSLIKQLEFIEERGKEKGLSSQELKQKEFILKKLYEAEKDIEKKIEEIRE